MEISSRPATGAVSCISGVRQECNRPLGHHHHKHRDRLRPPRIPRRIPAPRLCLLPYGAAVSHPNLVRIEWPSGAAQELENIASKQFLTVTEPGGEPRLAATRENGQVQLTLTRKQGSRYALETSTALPDWTSAGLTVTNQSGMMTFPAAGATNDAQRFYRAVWK